MKNFLMLFGGVLIAILGPTLSEAGERTKPVCLSEADCEFMRAEAVQARIDEAADNNKSERVFYARCRQALSRKLGSKVTQFSYRDNYWISPSTICACPDQLSNMSTAIKCFDRLQ